MRARSSNCRSSGMTGSNNTGSIKKRPYGMLLVLALGAAVLSVVLLHKLRERRVFGLLLEDCDRQLLTLRLLLQREEENSKEMKSKLEGMKAKALSFRAQKMELANKLTETEIASSYLKKIQRELEAALEEKQNQINALREKEAEFVVANLQVANLTRLLQDKEAEVKQMKNLLMKQNEQHSQSMERKSDDSNGTGSEQWLKIKTNEDDEDTISKDDSNADKGTNSRGTAAEEARVLEEKESGNPQKSRNSREEQAGSVEQKPAAEAAEQKSSNKHVKRSKRKRRVVISEGKEPKEQDKGQSESAKESDENVAGAHNASKEGNREGTVLNSDKLEVLVSSEAAERSGGSQNKDENASKDMEDQESRRAVTEGSAVAEKREVEHLENLKNDEEVEGADAAGKEDNKEETASKSEKSEVPVGSDVTESSGEGQNTEENASIGDANDGDGQRGLVSEGIEPERQTGEHLENPKNEENVEAADTASKEDNREATISSKDKSEVPASSEVTGSSRTEGQNRDKNPSKIDMNDGDNIGSENEVIGDQNSDRNDEVTVEAKGENGVFRKTENSKKNGGEGSNGKTAETVENSSNDDIQNEEDSKQKEY